MKFDITIFAPCEGGLRYYKNKNSFEEAWSDCKRGDWMLWLAYKLNVYKLGLKSGAKYDADDLWRLVSEAQNIREYQNGVLASGDEIKIYFKDSLLRAAGLRREDLPANCVDRDYNIFKKK